MTESAIAVRWIPPVRWTEVGVALAGISATVGGIVSCSEVRTPVTSDYGLVAVMPRAFWLWLAVLTVVMLVALNVRRVSWQLMCVLQLCLCLFVYLVPTLITDVPRTEVAWRHLGISSSLLGSGQVDPSIDAYFNWPGFFAGLGALLETAGMDPQTVALWAPLVNGVLWLAGVALVVRALTTDVRHRWLAMWIFTLTNWIDQDYLSPQAFAFFLYLVIIALLLTTLAAEPTARLRTAIGRSGVTRGLDYWWRTRRPSEPDGALRVAGVLLVVFLAMVMVASHQLTPFALVAAVVLLTIAGRTWATRLGVVTCLAVVLWLTTAAASYLAGHPVLFQDQVGGGTSADLAARLEGSPGHTAVVHVRTLFTAAVWALAGVGAFRLWRRRTLDWRGVLLFVVPFTLVPANSYGGEMLLRATLFAAPFTAYLAAAAVLPRGRKTYQPAGLWAVAVLFVAMSVALFTSRYGNARFDMFTENEVKGSEAMYSMAEPGNVLIAGAHPTPWRFRDYGRFRHSTLTELCPPGRSLVSCYPDILARAARESSGALLLLNRANEAAMEMQGIYTPEQLTDFEDLLRQDDRAVLVYENPDVKIYRIAGGGGAS